MAEKRIINLTEATELSGGDYLVVDSASSGTRKVSGSVINSAIGEVASDLDTLSARVDQIIAPSGEAPSAAEVSDARVGADGVTYTTLGGAIRTQITDLKSDINNVESWFEDTPANANFLVPTQESGYYDTSTGEPVASTSHVRTPNAIKLPDEISGYLYINFRVSRALITDICFYSGENTSTFIEQKSIANVTSYTMTVPAGSKYIRVWMGKSSGETEILKDVSISITNGGYIPYVMNGKLKTENLNDDTIQLLNDSADISAMFSTEIAGHNILPPDTEAGYYDVDTGQPAVQSGYRRTPEAIPTNGYRTLHCYLKQNYNMMFVCAFYSSESTDDYLGQKNFSGQNTTYNDFIVFDGTTHVRFWANGAFDFADMCIATSQIGAYEPYTTKKALSENGLDADAIGDIRGGVPLKEKNIVNMGDSIVGMYQFPNDISTVLADITRANTYNCGFGGCRMSAHEQSNWDAFSMYRLAYAIANNSWTLQDNALNDASWSDKPSYFKAHIDLLKSIDFSEADIVTIGYGTNDFTANVYLENQNDPDDTTTFIGALRYSIETLLSAFPNLKVFVCTPTYRFWFDSSYVFTEDSNTKENSRGNTLIDFCNSCKSVCREYNLPCIDNYDIGMGKYTRTHYFASNDGTHPNFKGITLIAKHIAHELW